jgi:two-component system sensor histidine kinase HydH
LSQLFHNLILNSFQALSGQGQLTLSCRREENMMVFTVEDDGPGTSSIDLVRFFEPFFTTKKMGTGLGLAISRKIVEDHGGTIEAKTKQPHGMVLKITFPTYVAAPVESASPPGV